MLPRTSVGSDAFSQLEFAPTNVWFLSEAKRTYNLEKGFVDTLSTARPAAGLSLLVTIRPLTGAFPRRCEHGENKGSDRKSKSSANFAIPDAPCLGERRINPGDDFGSPFFCTFAALARCVRESMASSAVHSCGRGFFRLPRTTEQAVSRWKHPDFCLKQLPGAGSLGWSAQSEAGEEHLPHACADLLKRLT